MSEGFSQPRSRRSSFVMDVLHTPVQFDVHRSRRRRSRIGIDFQSSDRVALEAPPRTSLKELRAMVSENERWFAARLRAIAGQSPLLSPPRYQHGEWLLFGGLAHRLQICVGQVARAEVRRCEDDLRVWLPQDADLCTATRTAVRAFQTREARRLLDGRLSAVVDELDWLDRVPPWRLRYMRTQWGSCQEDGRLAFNTHLVKLPVHLVDHVVLHELCHLQHLDHSPRFYALMARHQPDWRQRQTALHGYGGLLGER